ncbi:MAG: hypothetical protein NVSMB64_06100 [Candidatus Velthaea sp.]
MDIPKNLELKVGSAQVFKLPGLGAAGYQWFSKVDDERVVIVKKLASPPPPDLTVELSTGGVAPDEAFSVEAHTSGKTVVHFFQRRVFEKDKPPRDKYDVHVMVRP